MKTLIANAGPATCISEARLPTLLTPLLSQRNGFYSYERSLHVFGSGESMAPEEMTVERWNTCGSAWSRSFPQLATHVVFAEDLFGGPFSVDPRGHVFRTDPEVAETVHYADSLLEWASRIETDPAGELGSGLGIAWQQAVRRLASAERLLPIRPFVLGGDYEVDNLIAVSNGMALSEYVQLARVLRSIPDGQTVSIDFWLCDVEAVPPSRGEA